MSRQYTGLPKYLMVKNGKVFDTTFIFPHVECYFIEDGKLYYESISGDDFYLGHIVARSNDLAELEEMSKKANI